MNDDFLGMAILTDESWPRRREKSVYNNMLAYGLLIDK